MNDANEDLVNVYKVIKNNVDLLIEDLKKHKNEKDYYYEIRKLDRTDAYGQMSDIEKASRIIFLNKTCFKCIMLFFTTTGDYPVDFCIKQKSTFIYTIKIVN
ncbi:DNA adenine methylase [Orenia metallireducens]|uniref:DNA adenine methylase n=1 Tax=Orenia metallireducens TaxID=1413210 RepID=UPI002158E7A3|nr:DNA adenine methylase [Orenia metallireducens]